jgi:hypothetical protein
MQVSVASAATYSLNSVAAPTLVREAWHGDACIPGCTLCHLTIHFRIFNHCLTSSLTAFNPGILLHISTFYGEEVGRVSSKGRGYAAARVAVDVYVSECG